MQRTQAKCVPAEPLSTILEYARAEKNAGNTRTWINISVIIIEKDIFVNKLECVEYIFTKKKTLKYAMEKILWSFFF